MTWGLWQDNFGKNENDKKCENLEKAVLTWNEANWGFQGLKFRMYSKETLYKPVRPTEYAGSFAFSDWVYFKIGTA